jgi:hypothetical protein
MWSVQELLDVPIPVAKDIFTFLLTFIASPLHLHNPYLRGQLVQVCVCVCVGGGGGGTQLSACLYLFLTLPRADRPTLCTAARYHAMAGRRTQRWLYVCAAS